MASNVPSRELMPVPPVVTMICVRGSASCARTCAVTCAGSSLTIAWPVTRCPRPSSSARMARRPYPSPACANRFTVGRSSHRRGAPALVLDVAHGAIIASAKQGRVT